LSSSDAALDATAQDLVDHDVRSKRTVQLTFAEANNPSQLVSGLPFEVLETINVPITEVGSTSSRIIPHQTVIALGITDANGQPTRPIQLPQGARVTVRVAGVTQGADSAAGTFTVTTPSGTNVQSERINVLERPELDTSGRLSPF
jgi:hypothetical protein